MGILARSIAEFYRNRLGTTNKTPAMVRSTAIANHPSP